MKKWIIFSLLAVFISCSEYIEKPEKLVDEETMAEILAEFAIAEQMVYTFPKTNLESETQYILNQRKIKSKDFLESYKYYVVKRKMEKIADKAQEKILEKDPGAEKYIKEKQKGIPNVAPPLFK